MKKLLLMLTILSFSLSSIFSVTNTAVASNKNLVLDNGSVNLYTIIEETGMSFRAMADPWHSYAFGLDADRKIDLSKISSEVQKVEGLSIIGTGDVSSDSIVSVIFRIAPFKRTITSTIENVVNETTVYPEMVVNSHYSDFPYIEYPVSVNSGYHEYIYTFTIKDGVYSDGIELMDYYLKWNGSDQFSSGKYLSVVTITYRRDD
jgi:hypothetical protein